MFDSPAELPAETGGGAALTLQRASRVEIVIPVYNEERALAGCIRTLHAYLAATLPYEWNLAVVDNASTDRTCDVARELAAELPGLRVVRLEEKGRGRALRTAWSSSDAEIVAYMDVDLSTGLDAILPMLAPLISDHSDIAIGSRLASGSRTIRGFKREFISRGYNMLVRLVHGVPHTDMQCGFKAARRESIATLLERVEDDGWFFDTELLLLAHHNGLRLYEVPVDWVEDVDSRVAIAGTAWADIKGLVRVARARLNRTADIPVRRRADPAPFHPDARTGNGNRVERIWQVLLFCAVGAVSTVAHGLLYMMLREWWPVMGANLAALILCTLLNTEANRRLTFRRSAGAHKKLQAHLKGLGVFTLYFLFTSLCTLLWQRMNPGAGLVYETLVLLTSALVGTVARFLLMRDWVFAGKRAGRKSGAQR
ncbi:bifunctional glycosyltransferase family 2/GtrA family protein [Sinosporangium siamense]|uniref:dolichyl-phosphate beta-glucosyltransferase n=1 Tax=Sinosporangium siamense TaxID=1367973 RepID=A0A919RJN5_9ACTN|nr:bifunctional glycosyltransferase family 2/GtrA family protein [Sinosporangium siamense]GII95080.1 polysaccharide synthesis protein GtrA [Sinosporangium siamense]